MIGGKQEEQKEIFFELTLSGWKRFLGCNFRAFFASISPNLCLLRRVGLRGFYSLCVFSPQLIFYFQSRWKTSNTFLCYETKYWTWWLQHSPIINVSISPLHKYAWRQQSQQRMQMTQNNGGRKRRHIPLVCQSTNNWWKMYLATSAIQAPLQKIIQELFQRIWVVKL